MTPNLLTLTREKREFAMKRFLMPATALATTKKVAFAILCCTLLMLFAAPAWADQCSAPTVGVGTGARRQCHRSRYLRGGHHRLCG